MDRVTTIDEFEQEIETVMCERRVDREEAETIVALRHGELHGDGDLLFTRPLTDEQRRRLRIGWSIFDVIAEDQAREDDVGTAPGLPAPVDRLP